MASQSPLVLVAGTGTNVGKTHVATVLIRAWGAERKVVGYKPIETGVAVSDVGEDARRLSDASTFHVQRRLFGYALPEPVSPHLAARRAGQVFEFEKLVAQVTELRELAEGVVVELAGGVFTPLSREWVNLDLAKALEATAVLLVAPDRIGVLHDVGATLRAALGSGLRFDAIALSAPPVPDASTGTNAVELFDITGIRVLASFPWAAIDLPASIVAAEAVLEGLNLRRSAP
jgi:dethiobiotin synthetase